MAIGGEGMRNDRLEELLGRHVRQARVHKVLTQAEVAKRANVSLGALRHLESGSGATVSTLVKVLRALGQEEWLTTLANEPDQASFNPLDLLSAAEAEQAARTRRVRRRRAAAP
jgi:transcriptional regulator with XRE-family HTH domain